LEHEHRIRVSLAGDPVNRAQLWRGLVLRAEHPQHFVPGLDGCVILERTTHRLERELRFGGHRIRDRVLLTAGCAVRYEVHGAGSEPTDTLEMQIEEPEPGALLLRFRYCVDPHRSGLTDPDQQAVLKQAYTDADHHTVELIRSFAARGWLD
jgi:hypothetical protein